MKKIGKLAAMIASATLALTMGAFALTGCASGKDYTFEAEDAKTEGETMGFDESFQMVSTPAKVETNIVYGTEDEEVTGLGTFNGVGQKIIWTVNAKTDCSVNITLYAASAIMDMEGWNLLGLLEADLGDTEKYSFKVNDAEVAISGKLPATDTTEQGMQTPGCWWHIGTATAKANLKAGDNTIVLEIVGQNAGLNVDKIVINSTAELK